MTSRTKLPAAIQLCLDDPERSTVNAYGVTELLASPEATRKSNSLLSELKQSLGEPRREVGAVRLTNQRGFGGHEILEVARQFSFGVGGGTLLAGTFAFLRRWVDLGSGRKVSLRYESGEDGTVTIDLSGFTEKGMIELVKQLIAKGPGGRI